MAKAYSSLIGLTIKEAQKDGIPFDRLMTDMFESVLLAERDVFLREQTTKDKGNGYYHRFVPSFQGKLRVAVPRDRLGAFQPLFLELARQQSSRCGELALQLYGAGLSTRRVEQIVEQMFGERMSASKVSEIAQSLEPLRRAWQERPLANEYASLMIDALRINVRREQVYLEACFLVLGTKPDGRREVLGMYLFAEEGAHAWRQVFADLRDRGLHHVPLIVSDELSGITEAVAECFPRALHQLCLVHRKRNLMVHIRSDRKEEFSRDFNDVFRIDQQSNTVEAVGERLKVFIEKWQRHISNLEEKLAAEKLLHYCAFLAFPVSVRRMVYSTNWIERLNREIRKVTKRVSAFPNPTSLFNLVFMAMQPLQDGPYRRQIPAFRESILPIFPDLMQHHPDTQG
jgi:transposase-like protein